MVISREKRRELGCLLLMSMRKCEYGSILRNSRVPCYPVGVQFHQTTHALTNHQDQKHCGCSADSTDELMHRAPETSNTDLMTKQPLSHSTPSVVSNNIPSQNQ